MRACVEEDPGAAHESMCRRESGNTTFFGTKDTKGIELPLEWSAALGEGSLMI